MIAADRLARLPLFQGESPAVVRALAKRATIIHAATNEVLFLTNSESRGWWIVLDGKVRVVRGDGARQHVVHTEGPGGTLGEVPLVSGGTHPATAIAVESIGWRRLRRSLCLLVEPICNPAGNDEIAGHRARLSASNASTASTSGVLS